MKHLDFLTRQKRAMRDAMLVFLNHGKYVFLLGLMLCFFAQPATAQQVLSVDDLIGPANASTESNFVSQDNRLYQLINEENPALYIQDGEFYKIGGKTPVILDLETRSFEAAYKPNADFESIELIRIRINEPADWDYVLNMSQLSSFKNLRYVFYLVTYEICPELTGDKGCYSKKVNSMLSLPTQEMSFQVVYKVSILM